MKTPKWNVVHWGEGLSSPDRNKKSARVNSFTKRLQGLPGPRVEEHLYECTLKPVRNLIPLNLDGYMFTDEWDLGVLKTEIKLRVAADFRGWETDSVKFDEQVGKVIKALRADEGAREPPPKPQL